MTTWNEKKLQRYIDDEVEESTELDYKAAGALTPNNNHEITKDVSAMANAVGGILIYGLKENPNKKYVVEKFDPIDRTAFSKERLDHIISNIRPHIEGIVIHPVRLSTGSNDVAYVVEIPKGHTAHQAASLRYYRRRNFESVAMEDYEIREVMNRTTVANASVRFESKLMMSTGERKQFVFLPLVKNSGNQIIHNFKLTFKFSRGLSSPASIRRPQPNLNITVDKEGGYFIDYHSVGVLFQGEERPIGEEIEWTYDSTPALIADFRKREAEGRDLMIPWTLYADNMPSKHGEFPLGKLHDEY